MCYNTFLKVTMDLGLWYVTIKSSKRFFRESGQVVITSYSVVQHVTKG